jgi:hypothetical protein
MKKSHSETSLDFHDNYIPNKTHDERILRGAFAIAEPRHFLDGSVRRGSFIIPLEILLYPYAV